MTKYIGRKRQIDSKLPTKVYNKLLRCQKLDRLFGGRKNMERRRKEQTPAELLSVGC